MATTKIEIKCTDQVLSLVKCPTIASGGIEENEITFTFSDHWNGFAKKALFYRSTDAVYKVDIDENNKCVIPAIVLTEPGKLYIGVYATSGNVRRTSDVVVYRIMQGSNADAPDPLEQYKQQWAEETKGDLADALTTSATASELSPIPAYDEMTLDELIEEVEDNLIYTEEEQTKVGVYDAFKAIYERSTTIPRIVTTQSGITEPYEVPYLNTSLMTEGYNAQTIPKISGWITKMGLDLSSAPNNFLNGNASVAFSGASRLTDLKLTGCQSQVLYFQAFYNRTALNNIQLYGFNANHTITGNNMTRAFYGCSALESITGDDGGLDFEGIPQFSDTFKTCTLLKNIEIKPNTIQANISFAESTQLTGESVLSIINGLMSVNNLTLSLSNVTKTHCNFWTAKLNEETDLYEFCETSDPDAVTFTDIVAIKGWTLR